MDPAVIVAIIVAALPVIIALGKAVRWATELVLTRLDKRATISPASPPVADVSLTIPTAPPPPDDHADDAISAWEGRALACEARESRATERAELAEAGQRTLQALLDAERQRTRDLEAQLTRRARIRPSPGRPGQDRPAQENR